MTERTLFHIFVNSKLFDVRGMHAQDSSAG